MVLQGFISRLRRRTSIGKWRKKKTKEKKNEEKEEPSNSDRNGKPAPNGTSKAVTAAINNNQIDICKPQTPDKEPERDSTVKNSDGEESEIIVDDMIPRVLPWQDDASRGGLVLDVAQPHDTQQGLALVPSTIDVGFDDVSAISLEGCLRAEEEKEPSARAANDTNKQSALAENPKKQEEASPSGIAMPQTKEVSGSHSDQKGEGQEATAIEVILPGDADEQRQEGDQPPGERSSLKMDPTGRDCTSGAGAEEILASLQQQEQRRSIHRHPLYPQQDVRHQNHLPYIPHHLLPQQQQQPGTPKQKNKLLKYQQSNRKVAEMKKHIKGYFRYVPRGEEDNDVSVISI